MEDNRNFIKIGSSDMLYIEKDFLDKYRYYFDGVCECACLVMELKNQDVILYHALYCDSQNDAIIKLESLGVTKDNISELYIMGGNLNYRYRPSENAKLFIKNSKEQDLVIMASEIYDSYQKINPGVIRMSIIAEDDMHGMKNIPRKNNILLSNIAQDQRNNEKDIIDKMEQQNIYKVITPGIYCKIQYEDFCGPQNLQKLRNIAKHFEFTKINELYTPIRKNIEYQNHTFSLIDKKDNTASIPVLAKRAPTPTKVGATVFCNKMSDIYQKIEEDLSKNQIPPEKKVHKDPQYPNPSQTYARKPTLFEKTEEDRNKYSKPPEKKVHKDPQYQTPSQSYHRKPTLPEEKIQEDLDKYQIPPKKTENITKKGHHI